MAGSLLSRLERLEAKSGDGGLPAVRLVRLCITEEDICAALEEAARNEIREDEVMIVHLVPLS